jgi:hypothetical protein
MAPSPSQGSQHPSGEPPVSLHTDPEDDETHLEGSHSNKSLSRNEEDQDNPFARYMAELEGFQVGYEREIPNRTEGLSDPEVRETLWSEQRPTHGPVGAINLSDGTETSGVSAQNTATMSEYMVPAPSTSGQETAVGFSAHNPVAGM